ncbi:DUF3861 domain-containing protein [Uruburuella testudinis]|uniref:DUF3861 domain-containing protein n=1 Tax=Uruburuella testudinis TaxID=1282863 RepID=A0ABY4DUQ9_9NEIS|nr:DUF3861 domain-containing protein [Uruburuella testudinis]UOO81357.1 DUF3861 domain-containing protein [Uruburuella testudinis]
MKQHQYRVTLEYLADADGHAVEQAPLVFDAPNHDNIFSILEMMGRREDMTPEMAQRFTLGLKLMSEVMLENKNHPLFAQLRPHLLEIMQIVKGKKTA